MAPKKTTKKTAKKAASTSKAATKVSPKASSKKTTIRGKKTLAPKATMGRGKQKKGDHVYSSTCVGSGDNLMIVESPNKVRSVSKYLGSGWRVMATFGHCFCMPRKGIPINTTDWTASFIIDPPKVDVVAAIKAEAKKSKEIYLATDPDREGEAIAWFIYDAIQPIAPKAQYYRVTFNAITKQAVQTAVQAKTSINMDMVYAQRARSYVDRLVGYTVSPLVQHNVLHSRRAYHAAGRVQSVALRILTERQREIEAFTAEEFWEIFVNTVTQDGDALKLELVQYKGKTIKVTNETDAQRIVNEIKGSTGKIISIKEKDVTINPKPPFTTSTLLQAASTQLGFSSDKTMNVAQQLFENAFISYHRTDSVRLEPSEVQNAMTVLKDNYGTAYVAKSPIQYKSKSHSKVQDAHTAIQPTHPENATISGTPDMIKLYDIIRKRFLACQSTPSLRKSKTILAEFGNYEFKVQGSTLVFDGYKKILGQEEDDEEAVELPNVMSGDKLVAKKMETKQKFTQPPAYFNDASLIKAMESEGVGRPSTYASAVNVLLERFYVEKDGKKLVVTQDGYNVMDYLIANFDDIFHSKFTATMENGLDEIEDGRKDWKDYMTSFWATFESRIKAKNIQVLNVTGKKCPICNTEVKQYPSRFGPHYTCETDECPAKFDKMTGEYLPEAGKCPNCGRAVIERNGRNGPFLGCTGFPHCKTICIKDENGNLIDQKTVGNQSKPSTTRNVVGTCTECGSEVIERTGKYGKFYGCSNYPNCKTIFTLGEDGMLAKKAYKNK